MDATYIIWLQSADTAIRSAYKHTEFSENIGGRALEGTYLGQLCYMTGSWRISTSEKASLLAKPGLAAKVWLEEGWPPLWESA